MKKQKDNYHGYSKQMYLTLCARNIILQVPFEQDTLLLDYSEEIASTISTYLINTNDVNLDLIYRNKFKYRVAQIEGGNTFHMKFDYFHD